LTNSEANPIPAPADKFLPGPVLLLGAPGVGKGTQAQILMATYGILQISTGDILRANIARGTDLGLAAKELVSKGLFVSDEIVDQMVWQTITSENVASGFVLDGYPRTLSQAQFIDHVIAGSDSPVKLPLVAISITVDYDVLLHRITGRRTCPVCKSIYNIFSNPPKVTGVCDLEGAELIQRSDDTEEVFRDRMKTFDLQTAPVVSHYRAQGRFAEVDGDHPVEQVTSAITEALKRLRKGQR